MAASKFGYFSLACKTYKYNEGDIDNIDGYAVDPISDIMDADNFRVEVETDLVGIPWDDEVDGFMILGKESKCHESTYFILPWYSYYIL